jgi:hypothetical protein
MSSIVSEMIKPVKLHKRVKRTERYDDRCYCCGEETDCGVCGLGIIVASVALLLVITTTILTFSNMLQVCSSSSQCTAGVGEIARCRGICLTDRILGHCSTSDDCVFSQCHTATCSVEGKCIYTPVMDGVPCEDVDSCTSNDVCTAGVCAGTRMESPCQKCVNGVFVPDNDLDGSVCSDSSLCTSHDTCSNGQCAGTPVLCGAAMCKTAVCDAATGCSLINNDYQFQIDLCTSAECKDGEYTETHKDCFDGNPCTNDACYPLSGICVHSTSSESCLTVCTQDSDCSAIGTNTDYACWDGNCVDVTSSENIIRISHAEVDHTSCPLPGHSRLQLRFYMDSSVQNGVMHIPKSNSIMSIFPHMDIFDVDNTLMYDGSAVRSYFSARSPCFDLAQDCFPFVDGDYEFSVKRYACTSLDTAFCNNDIVSTTNVIAPINLIDCPGDTIVIVTPSAELLVERIGNTEIKASLDVEEIDGWLVDVQFCIPKNTPMKGCILDVNNINCPYRGCSGTPEYYLDKRVTFLQDGNYTGAVTLHEYAVELARGYANYAGDRCANVSAVDFIKFDLGALVPEYAGEVGVLDITFTVPLCTQSRRLSEPVRKIGSWTI